jgi:hypothetical protein
MRRAGWGIVIVFVVACGGDGGGDDGDDGDDGPDQDAMLETCAIIATCSGEDISSCVEAYGPLLTPTQIACIRAATIADCRAMLTCLGTEITTDPACAEGCDGDSYVQCDGGLRVAYDCAAFIESVGSTCVVGATRMGCGTGTCTVDGEQSCAGTVFTVCDSGIAEGYDCARMGLECVAGRGCHGPMVGTCTAGTPAACDGDGLVECIGTALHRIDCPALLPGSTCVDAGTARCGYGTACVDGLDSCAGSVLQACVLGGPFSIDCTAIGGTACTPTPQTAECTP